MINHTSINIPSGLDRAVGERLQKSLSGLPGVKKVEIFYPQRVVITYDASLVRASNFLNIIHSMGLKTAVA